MLAQIEVRWEPQLMSAGAQPMTQEQAREKIVALWPSWAKKNKVENANGRDGLMFFTFIQREHARLLSFKTASNDKWQVVHGWLMRARLVSD